MKYLSQIRYYLEIISVPVFAFLVGHLAGEAFSTLFQMQAGLIEPDRLLLGGSESFLLEVVGGGMTLILFVWLWHRPYLKKLVPCSHDHCHHQSIWPHVLATLALVLHWVPESEVRSQMLNNFSIRELTDLITAFGFLTHFLVDVIVVILLMSYWAKLWQKLTMLWLLIGLWLATYWLGEHGGFALEGPAEPFMLLLSAFLLAMFVHKPHKPQPECVTCNH